MRPELQHLAFFTLAWLTKHVMMSTESSLHFTIKSDGMAAVVTFFYSIELRKCGVCRQRKSSGARRKTECRYLVALHEELVVLMKQCAAMRAGVGIFALK